MHVLQRHRLEARGFDPDRVGCHSGRLGEVKLPLSFETTTLSLPVASLRIVIFAFGSRAPDGSDTAPETEELSDCAERLGAR